jgi:hypothetical protein
MSKAVFQIMGGFVLGFAAMLVGADVLWIGHFSLHLPGPVTMIGLARSAFIIGTLTLVGVGLLYLRKWAALALSILMTYPAFWCVWGAVHPVPGNANWLGFFFAALLLTPSILTAKYWRILVWRKSLNQTSVMPST